MAWIKQYRRARSNATNFGHKNAQKRIEEAIPSFRKKIENSLSINTVGMILFRKVSLGRVCSCKATIELNNGNDVPILDPNETISFGSFDNDLMGDRYGDEDEDTDMPTAQVGNMIDDLEDEDFDENDMGALNVIEAMGVDGGVSIKQKVLNSGNNVKCGVCFKTGVQPGFEPVGFVRNVLTTYDAEQMHGYTVDNTAMPAHFEPLMEDSFVEFEVVVPKYFTEALIGVWDNTDLYYPDLRTVSGEPLTNAHFEQARGGKVRFRIVNFQFTHVVIMFDQGVEPMSVNIGGETRTMDFDTDLIVGSLTVVGPEQLGLVVPGDVLVIPERKLFLIATDVPKKQTAQREQWEWEIQTRTVQPAEIHRNLYRYQRLAQ